MKPLLFLALAVVGLGGCDSAGRHHLHRHLTNREIVAESKICMEGGMGIGISRCGAHFQPVRVVCDPNVKMQSGKEEIK